MKKLVIAIVLVFLLLVMPLASAQPDLIVYGKDNSIEPFIAEAGSKLILFARLEIDGEIIWSCNVYDVSRGYADPCTDMTWGFKDPYTYEVSENECMLVPTSYGVFQCVIDVPETPGETYVSFGYKTSGEKAVGELSVAGGGKRKLIVYKCGDGECNGPETQETCCTDCGVLPRTRCVNNKLELIPCDGCLVDTTCFPLGIRKEGMYCSIDNEFVGQKIEDEYCDNNFECKSNICVSGECVGEGLIQKIINFFKRLFGIDEEEDAELPRTEEVLENCPLFESVFEEFELEPEEIEKGLKDGTLPWACKNDPSMSEVLERGCEWDDECCSDLPRINNVENAQDFVEKFFYCFTMDYMSLGPGAPPGPVTSVNVTTSGVRKLKYGYFMYIVPYLVTVRESTVELTGGKPGLEEGWLYLSDSGCVLPCPTEEEIPYEPDYWVYCTEEDEELGKECQERGGVPQGGPHPDKDKNCDVYTKCIFGERRD